MKTIDEMIDKVPTMVRNGRKDLLMRGLGWLR